MAVAAAIATGAAVRASAVNAASVESAVNAARAATAVADGDRNGPRGEAGAAPEGREPGRRDEARRGDRVEARESSDPPRG